MNLTISEEQELLAMLSTDLREAEEALEVSPGHSAERQVRILARAVGNVQQRLRMKLMDAGPLGDVAHTDLFTAARAFATAQALHGREIVVRFVIGTAESRVFLFEKMGAAFVEVPGALANADALHALCCAVAGFTRVALDGLDQAKRVAIKDALAAGATLGVDVHVENGFASMSVGKGGEAVLVCAVAVPEKQAVH